MGLVKRKIVFSTIFYPKVRLLFCGEQRKLGCNHRQRRKIHSDHRTKLFLMKKQSMGENKCTNGSAKRRESVLGYNLSVSPTARQPVFKGRTVLCTTSQALRASSPGRGAIGRPGQPCCSHRPDRAQSAGPCPNGQQLWNCALTKDAGQAAVNLDSEARSFTNAKNFARPARPSPTRQGLPYQGSCLRSRLRGCTKGSPSGNREAATERFISLTAPAHLHG